MVSGYIEQRDGGYFLTATRVSLDSVVYSYLRGESPEGIAESFPALSLDQVFGALAYYIANRETPLSVEQRGLSESTLAKLNSNLVRFFDDRRPRVRP